MPMTEPIKKSELQDLVRRDLIHPWGEPKEKFLQLIDDTGGWPVGYTYVSFYHDGPCGNRYCVFTTYPLQTEWWTMVCNADEYYLWKLSPNALKHNEKEARRKLIQLLNRMD
jgi:hypothetical protein